MRHDKTLLSCQRVGDRAQTEWVNIMWHDMSVTSVCVSNSPISTSSIALGGFIYIFDINIIIFLRIHQAKYQWQKSQVYAALKEV